MTEKTKLAPPVIRSKNLLAYKLIKRHQNILNRFEEMKKYMALAGKAPEVVRLSIADYAGINAAVDYQSDGKRSLADLNYDGLPILSVEKSLQMELAS